MARFTEEQYLRFERAIAQAMAQRTDNSDSVSDSESLPDPELRADNSTIRKRCPEKEVFVLDDSSPDVKGEARPGPLYSGPPAEIFLDDSPPYFAPASPEESRILPPSLSDLLENVSDSDLPPIVPPPFLLFPLDPISDKSLPTTPTKTSPPVSMPDITYPMSSPPKFSNELHSKVMLRSDGVLIFKDVLNKSIVSNVAKLPKQMIKFAKNLFKDSVPDLVDIPTQTVKHIASELINQQSKSTSAEVKDAGPPMPSECQDSNLIENLLSANNLLMSLPDSFVCQKSNLAKGVEKKRKLPQCFAEVEIEEPKVIKNVKAPQPIDEMEVLLDKRRRKKLIKRKVKSRPTLNRVESSEKVNVKVSGARDAINNQKFELAILQAETTSFKSKKKKVVSKKSNEIRKYKDKDKIRSLIPFLETEVTSSVTTPSSPDTKPDFVAPHSELSTCHTNCELDKPSPDSSKLPVVQIRSSFLDSQVSDSVSSSSPSPSMSRSSSMTPPVSSTTKAAIYIPTSLSPTVPSIPILTANPTSLSNSPTPDSCTTSQLPNISLVTDQSSPAASKNFPAFPSQVSSDPSSSALGLDDLANLEATANRAQGQKNGKLKFVDPDPVLGIEYQMEWQLANSPEQSSSPVTKIESSVHHSVTVSPTTPSHPPTPPPHQGEVMSLYQALGGSQDSEEEPEQPVVIRAGVDPMDKCPVCNIGLDTGPKALNFSINYSDLSVLVDCKECGVRVRLKEVLRSKQRAFLSCSM